MVVERTDEATGDASAMAIALRGVGLRREATWLLRGIDWTVPAGTTSAVLGPNGSGKSSLLRVVSGYAFPTEGEARVVGCVFGESDLHAMRRRIRLVAPPGPYDFSGSMTAREVVGTGFGGTLMQIGDLPTEATERIASELERVGIGGFGERRYGTLSTGERLRCQLARALMTDPELLLLDEATGGLDLPARESLIELLERLHGSLTMVVVTHHPDELPRTVDQVLLMRDGRIEAGGTPRQTLTGALLSSVFDLRVSVDHHDDRYWLRISR